jgi:hypothetical protein
MAPGALRSRRGLGDDHAEQDGAAPRAGRGQALVSTAASTTMYTGSTVLTSAAWAHRAGAPA